MSNLDMFKMQIQTYFRDIRIKTLLFIEMIMKSALYELLLFTFIHTPTVCLGTGQQLGHFLLMQLKCL